MYSACSLSFFNYPYVGPNVQTKFLGILEPTQNLVLKTQKLKSLHRPLEQGHFSYKVLYHMLVTTRTFNFEFFDKKRVVGLILKTNFDKALMLFWETLL